MKINMKYSIEVSTIKNDVGFSFRLLVCKILFTAVLGQL